MGRSTLTVIFLGRLEGRRVQMSLVLGLGAFLLSSLVLGALPVTLQVVGGRAEVQLAVPCHF